MAIFACREHRCRRRSDADCSPGRPESGADKELTTIRVTAHSCIALHGLRSSSDEAGGSDDESQLSGHARSLLQRTQTSASAISGVSRGGGFLILAACPGRNLRLTGSPQPHWQTCGFAVGSGSCSGATLRTIAMRRLRIR